MFVITVPASKPGEKYTVRKVADQFVCSCPDHLYRSEGNPYLCKHLGALAVEFTKFAVTAEKSKSAEKIISQA